MTQVPATSADWPDQLTSEWRYESRSVPDTAEHRKSGADGRWRDFMVTRYRRLAATAA